jgi:hypothetical protein
MTTKEKWRRSLIGICVRFPRSWNSPWTNDHLRLLRRRIDYLQQLERLPRRRVGVCHFPLYL